MANYDNNYPNEWIKDYKEMIPDPYSNRPEINDFIQKIIFEETRGKSTSRKGTENHLGAFEDVKQPLTLDPLLDF